METLPSPAVLLRPGWRPPAVAGRAVLRADQQAVAPRAGTVIAVLVAALGIVCASGPAVSPSRATTAVAERPGPPHAVDLTPPELPRVEDDRLEGIAVPVADDGVTAPLPAFDAVESTRAAVSVDVADARQEDAAVARAADLAGVANVAAVTVVRTTLGQVPATIAAVDPEAYRAFTPVETANHEPLWRRLAAGDVVVTHEFGTTHRAVLGSFLGVGEIPPPIRVGAFASNGTPPVGDAILSRTHAAALGLGGQRRVLIGLTPEASATAVVAALTEGGFAAEEIPDPRAPRTAVILPQGGITADNVWDHLALCESSGDWHINTGNGYYGGLQFLPESWWAVGGSGLPHEHGRSEQIHRATLLWRIQGWEAWPQCARRLGLIRE